MPVLPLYQFYHFADLTFYQPYEFCHLSLLSSAPVGFSIYQLCHFSALMGFTDLNILLRVPLLPFYRFDCAIFRSWGLYRPPPVARAPAGFAIFTNFIILATLCVFPLYHSYLAPACYTILSNFTIFALMFYRSKHFIALTRFTILRQLAIPPY